MAHPSPDSGLTHAQLGLYWRLVNAQLVQDRLIKWAPGGLADLFEMDPMVWARDWPAVAPLFDIAGGYITHPIVEFEVWRTLHRAYKHPEPDFDWRLRLSHASEPESFSLSETPRVLQKENLSPGEVGSYSCENLEQEPARAREGSLARDAVHLWESALERIRPEIDPLTFDTWLRPTSGAGLADNVLTVLVPNEIFQEWLSTRYSDRCRIAAGVEQIRFVHPGTREPSGEEDSPASGHGASSAAAGS